MKTNDEEDHGMSSTIRIQGATQAEHHIITQVEQNKDDLRNLGHKMDRLEAMMKKLFEHSEIEFDDAEIEDSTA